MRHDDGAGIEVARSLLDRPHRAGIEVCETQGEPVGLLEAWRAHDAVVLVDAMRSGARLGTIRRLDASHEPLPAQLRRSSSTHAFALDEAIELGRALGWLPRRVIVYAVEGRIFEAGVGLSDELDSVMAALTDAVLREASELAR